jgi:outer membrane biosynthesis protein TonB
VPPQVLVDGVRSLLIYAVETTGPNPRVFVEGGGQGQLAGVLGSATGVAAFAATVAEFGMAAAVAQPLPGGSGLRQVSIRLGDDAPPPPTPVPPIPPTPKPPLPKPPVPKPPVLKPPVKKPPVKTPPLKKPPVKTPVKKLAKKAKGAGR